MVELTRYTRVMSLTKVIVLTAMLTASCDRGGAALLL
jgi:hypothetical protein